MELQIASIYHPTSQDNSLVVAVVPVQQQSGGLTVVCLQQLLLSGDSLRRIQFDQSRMRSHLIRCFEEKKLEEFPFSSFPNHFNRAMLAHRVIHLFCTCRMPEIFNTKMVACDI